MMTRALGRLGDEVIPSAPSVEGSRALTWECEVGDWDAEIFLDVVSLLAAVSEGCDCTVGSD
jgi:hypothetical protein